MLYKPPYLHPMTYKVTVTRQTFIIESFANITGAMVELVINPQTKMATVDNITNVFKTCH